MVFSSVRLFEEIIKNYSGKFMIKRWQRIFILIMRAAILGLLASILAGPWFSSVGKITGAGKDWAGNASVVFLFDVSMSRSARMPFAGQETRADFLVQKDKQIASRITELIKERFADNPRIAVISYAGDVEKMRMNGVGYISGDEIFSSVLPTAKGTSHMRGLEAAVKTVQEEGLENSGRSVPLPSRNGDNKARRGGTIFWFTDLAAHGFSQLFPGNGISRPDEGISAAGGKFHPRFRLPDGVNLVVVTSNPLIEKTMPYSNLAIEGVESQPRSSGADESYFFDALVRSYEFEGVAFARLFSISSDGREKLIFEMPVNIRKNQLNRVRCFLPRGFDNAQGDGEFLPLMRFDIKGDEFLVADNSYYFRMGRADKKSGAVSGGLKILIVDGNPQPGRFSNVFYIESALKSSSAVGLVKTVTFVDFMTAYRTSPKGILEGYDAVIFSDFWPSETYMTDSEIVPTDFEKNYLASGASQKVVIFFPGERLVKSRMSVAEINGIRFYPESGAENSDAVLPGVKPTKKERIYGVKIGGDFFKEILGFQEADGFDWNIFFKKIHPVSYDGSEYISAASITDGENTPFIVCNRQDSGTRGGMFFFINTTSSREWSDFCAKPVFAVLLEKMILSARRRQFDLQGKDGSFAGGDIYGFAGEGYRHPSGGDFYKGLFYEDGKKNKVFPFAIPPEEPGIYRIKSSDGRLFKDSFYFVNTLLSESDIRQIEKLDDFVEKGRRDSGIYIIRHNPGDLSSVSVGKTSFSRVAERAVAIAFGRNLRKGIAAFVLILIVAENILMSLWHSGRGSKRISE